jgi:hypothetical protein
VSRPKTITWHAIEALEIHGRDMGMALLAFVPVGISHKIPGARKLGFMCDAAALRRYAKAFEKIADALDAADSARGAGEKA